MQTADQILQAIRKLGEKRLPLTRMYRCLFSEDLFLAAYDRIGRHPGALTPGTADETADGMNLKRIRAIIEQLRQERFRFRPSRRTYVPKKSGGVRPLGLPNFSEKLVQEVLRQILEAYYEPRFRESSHGFRPGRGCHTALTHIHHKFGGTTWFIEGDIRGCFDAIDHQVLMSLLARDIHDGRLLNLIQRGLDAGYLEDWRYSRTYSGVPQGGVLSPLLSNIYLHELDVFIEDVLIPQSTRGQTRARNREYQRLGEQIGQARAMGDDCTVRELEQQRRQLPSQDTQDPNYRRLKYCRYADDFILGFIGPKSEAEAVKEAIAGFLREKLHLEMSASKTLITHARTEHAQFLGYAISIYQADTRLTLALCHGRPIRRRNLNGSVRLGIPYGTVDEWAQPYQHKGKPIQEAVILHYSDAHIIETYQQRFRGVAEYYKYAADRDQLSKLKYVMEVALTKTLANKYRTSVSHIYRKYRRTRLVDGYPYKTLQVEVPTQRGTTTVYWGGISLKVIKPGKETIEETIRPGSQIAAYRKSDLIQRLQTNECELCGSPEDCQVHHIRKLSDLKKRWQGRKEKPVWVKTLIAIRRKTLVVCAKCHADIHAGRPTAQKRT